MPHLKHLLAIVLTLVALPCVADGPPPLGVTARGTCVNIVDGDTIDVEVRYVVRVRLLDCWASESNTPAGRRASRQLATHAAGKDVTLHVPTATARSMRDTLTLDRVLGRVWLRGESQSLNEWMVSSGHAMAEKTK